jgi:hypothetical protein
MVHKNKKETGPRIWGPYHKTKCVRVVYKVRSLPFIYATVHMYLMVMQIIYDTPAAIC